MIIFKWIIWKSHYFLVNNYEKHWRVQMKAYRKINWWVLSYTCYYKGRLLQRTGIVGRYWHKKTTKFMETDCFSFLRKDNCVISCTYTICNTTSSVCSTVVPNTAAPITDCGLFMSLWMIISTAGLGQMYKVQQVKLEWAYARHILTIYFHCFN